MPTSLDPTRDALHRVAVHIVARARLQASGRFGLRVTPNGFGTPEFGDLERVRVSGALLVHECGATAGAWSRVRALPGATLTNLAAVAGVDLASPLSVGADTPPLGDVDEPLAIDPAAATVLHEWNHLVARALDEVVAGAADRSPTLVQLWPEHFDTGLDLAYDIGDATGHRVNLGGSPGDRFSDVPYLYVGPWTGDRPGDPAFWNAPFGAALRYDEVLSGGDPVGRAVAFFRAGVSLLAG